MILARAISPGAYVALACEDRKFQNKQSALAVNWGRASQASFENDYQNRYQFAVWRCGLLFIIKCNFIENAEIARRKQGEKFRLLIFLFIVYRESRAKAKARRGNFEEMGRAKNGHPKKK